MTKVDFDELEIETSYTTTYLKRITSWMCFSNYVTLRTRINTCTKYG